MQQESHLAKEIPLQGTFFEIILSLVCRHQSVKKMTAMQQDFALHPVVTPLVALFVLDSLLAPLHGSGCPKSTF
jgi:hypothetical protein